MKPLQLIFTGSLLLCLAACQEDWNLDRSDFSQIELEKVALISANEAVLEARLFDLSAFTASDHGFVWTTDQSTPTVFSYDEKISLGVKETVDSASFSVIKSDLAPGTSFIIRAYAEVDGRVMYSDTIHLKTATGQVSTLAINYLGGFELTISGKLNGTELGVFGLKHGFCWSSTETPSLADQVVNLGSQLTNNEFSYVYQGLTEGEPLFFRAYGILQANQRKDTIYGEVLAFDGIIRNKWESKARVGAFNRTGAAAFSLDGKGYLIGGHDKAYNYLKDVWEYDPQADQWTQKSDFPGKARAFAAAFTINEKGYYGTGYSPQDGYLKDFYEYTPSSNTWKVRKDFPGTARSRSMSTSDGQYGYITTGRLANSGSDNVLYRFDPSVGIGQWTSFAGHSGVGRANATGFVLDSILYLTTGSCLESNCNFVLADVWAFDLNNQSWTELARFPGGTRARAVGFSANGYGYLGLGSSFGGVYLEDMWSYRNGEWKRMAPLKDHPRGDAISFIIDDKAYIGTGVIGTSSWPDPFEYFYTNDLWAFTILK